jgi:DnaK suppressor protein
LFVSGEEMPVSKPPAKVPAKAPAKSAGKPAPKAPAKPAAAAAKKADAKAPAKAAAKASAKAPPKTAARPAARPAPKAVAKPAPKPAAKSAPKAPAAQLEAKPQAHPPATASTTRPAGKPAAAAPVAAPLPPAAPSRSPAPPEAAAASNGTQASPTGGSAAAAPVIPHPTFAAPATNRFTDRFAPPRPTAPEVIEASANRPAKKIDPKLANAWKTKAGRDLTEDELLAMPDSEYMNEKQLEFFRTRLTQQKDDLLSNAGETTEHLREDTSIVPDPVDRATIEEEHALELRTRDRERKLLKKISQSLARLESGDYGYCDETGEPIGLARLLARPTATLSLEAQQRRELKQKMFGD